MTVKELLNEYNGEFDLVNYAAKDEDGSGYLDILTIKDVKELINGSFTHLAEREIESYQLIEKEEDAYGLDFLGYDFDEEGNLIGVCGDRNLERTVRTEGNVILYFEL